MWLKLMRLIAPFSQISRDLAIIRELYELELASRNPPLIRVTEQPKRGDTEVMYTEDTPKKTMKEKLATLWGENEDEDDTEDNDSKA